MNQDVIEEPRNETITQILPAAANVIRDVPDELLDNLNDLLQFVDLAYESMGTAQLCVLYAGSRLLIWAKENADEFEAYRDEHGIVGDTPETQVADLVQKRDPEFGNKHPNRNQRREYGNAMAWFADPELCPFRGEQAIKEAITKGRIGGIAKLAAEKRRKIGTQARTAAATEARQRQRQEAEAARQAEDAEVTRQHKEAQERRRAAHTAALQAALTGDAILAPPSALRAHGAPSAQPPGELPTVVIAPPQAAAGEGATDAEAGEAAAIADPAISASDGPGDTAEAGSGGDEKAATPLPPSAPDPKGLPDIKDYLHRVPQADRGWQLATTSRDLLAQEGIAPDPDDKPRAPISLLLQIVDPETMQPARYTIVDFDLCADGVVKLFDERRTLARIVNGEAVMPDGDMETAPLNEPTPQPGEGDDGLAEVAAQHRRRRHG